MIKKLAAITLLTLASVGSAYAQEGGWRDSSGAPAAESESRKSRDGFAGTILVTSDQDWKEKWNTPPETKPSFTTIDKVPYGKKIFILALFANPKLSQSGQANVRCDIELSGPDGAAISAQKDIVCFEGALSGPPRNVYMALPGVSFVGEPGDPSGIWKIDVTLRDIERNVELPLHASFELLAKEPTKRKSR